MSDTFKVSGIFFQKHVKIHTISIFSLKLTSR